MPGVSRGHQHQFEKIVLVHPAVAAVIVANHPQWKPPFPEIVSTQGLDCPFFLHQLRLLNPV